MKSLIKKQMRLELAKKEFDYHHKNLHGGNYKEKYISYKKK
jgi:hypothetical protein